MLFYDDPDYDYSQFLNRWGNTLLTGSKVKVVYHIGSSFWRSADDTVMLPTPNFIVRTVNPVWRLPATVHKAQVEGRFIGIARHDFINRVDFDALYEFCAQWHEFGWTPSPLSLEREHPYRAFEALGDLVRIIEVPAGTNWAGPQYLGRIPNGVSTDRFLPGDLQRYNSRQRYFDAPVPYKDLDETKVSKWW